MGIRRQRITIRLILLLNLSYLAQALYYAFLLLNKNELAPDYAIVHVLSAMLVLIVFAVALFTTSSPLWQPYAGTFVIEFLFQTAINGFLTRIPHHLRMLHLGLSVTRTTVSLGLLVASSQTENHTDEEAVALLGTSQTQGGWVPYLQRYAIFLPYLWPKEVKSWFATSFGLRSSHSSSVCRANRSHLRTVRSNVAADSDVEALVIQASPRGAVEAHSLAAV